MECYVLYSHFMLDIQSLIFTKPCEVGKETRGDPIL